MAVNWIAFHITDRCQLDCQHCLRDPAQKPRDADVALFERVLDQAKAAYASSHVSLTGGEPTLHPRLDAIVDAIAARGFDFHLVTNGKRFPEFLSMLDARPERLAALSGVNFSVDGATEQTHDRIRGSGSYREVVAAIALSHVRGLKLSMNFTVNALNEHEIEAFAIGAAKLGANRVQYNVLQATGTMHDRTLGLPLRAWDDVLDRVARLKDMLKIPVEAAEGFHRPAAFHVCEPFRSEVLHVDLLGRLNLCCQHSGVPTPEGHPHSDVAADLNEVSFVDAHARLLDIIHQTQKARLDAIRAGELDAWDHFICNWCMKHFGKPHWTSDGVGGVAANRERWRGAWSEDAQVARNAEPRRLPIVS